MWKHISIILPNQVAVVFDGWAAGSTNFINVFASFPSNAKDVYSARLLSFSQSNDETTFAAEDRVNFLTYALEVPNLSFSNVLCLIRDNCNTNKTVSNIF